MAVSEQGRERQTSNPVNDARRDEKTMRQKALTEAMVAIYKGDREYADLFTVLRELAIPWGTYSHWVGSGDEDWRKCAEEIKRARLMRYTADAERGMLTGEGLNRVPYIQGMLNRLDPDLREKIEHSGNVSNVQLTVSPGLGAPPVQAETPVAVGEGGRKGGQSTPD